MSNQASEHAGGTVPPPPDHGSAPEYAGTSADRTDATGAADATGATGATDQPAGDATGAADQPSADTADASNDPDDGAGGDAPGWRLRRAVRAASAETWDVLDADGDRIGAVALQYADGVEGVLALAGALPDESRRSLLGWLTDMLALDQAAGPGGTIHWTTVAGEATEYWRRAPGRRASGAENDLAGVRARVESVVGSLGAPVERLPTGDVAIDVGSVRVFVTVQLLEAEAAVRVFAMTNLDVDVEGALPAYLLDLNFGLAIGRFALDVRKRVVWCDHVLVGADVDDSSIARAVGVVAATADRFDDEIKARFGGRTFREEGSPVTEAVRLSPPGLTMAGGYL